MSGVECVTAEALQSDEAWWQLYQESFPASEREPPEVIVESVRRGVGLALRARREGVTFALATTHLLSSPAAVFLVYLAVASGARSRGAGGALLQSAWESGAARLRAQGLQPLGMIWEVDPPHPAAEDAVARQRRIAFFQRHGGRLLERRYVQPPMSGSVAVRMRLMFRAAEGAVTPPPETLEALVRAIYFDKYGALNRMDRSLLESFLSGK